MHGNLTVETDVFEHREVKPHFINPCCFGEDFAVWLRHELLALTQIGFSLSEPIQEDYGWGLWGRCGKDSFWIALSFAGEGPQEEPARWVVSIDQRSLNPLRKLFHRPAASAFTSLRDAVWGALKSNPAIRIVDE